MPLTLKSRTSYLVICCLDHLIVSSSRHVPILLDYIINEALLGGFRHRVVLVYLRRLAAVE